MRVPSVPQASVCPLVHSPSLLHCDHGSQLPLRQRRVREPHTPQLSDGRPAHDCPIAAGGRSVALSELSGTVADDHLPQTGVSGLLAMQLELSAIA